MASRITYSLYKKVLPRKAHLAWSGAPAGTKSFAITCLDIDVPTKPDDVNKPGRTVPYDLPRTEFVHWLLVNVPAGTTELREGQDADGLTPKGKPSGAKPDGSSTLRPCC